MAVPDIVTRLADSQYYDLATIARLSAAKTQELWKLLPAPDDPAFWPTFYDLLPSLVGALQGYQMDVAVASEFYFRVQAEAQGITILHAINPSAFQSHSEVLDRAMRYAAGSAYRARLAGLPRPESSNRGLFASTQQASTLVQDAGRTASSVAIADSDVDHWVRTLRPPSCDRCAILAGKPFSWRADFNRHPVCDCTVTPINDLAYADEMTIDPVEALRAGQVRGLSRADTEAVLTYDADLVAIVNKKRHKLDKSRIYGNGTRTRNGTPTPSEILKSGSRDEIRANLKRFGYTR